MMKARELIETCKRLAQEEKTCYIWGGCGMPVTEQTLADKLRQYPAQNAKFCERARRLLDKHGWMFDCVCLLKSVGWGFSFAWDKYYGGAVYGSNGVPDVSADGMIARCKDVSTDFTKITPGEALWLPGHIGLYIGSGLCVECTPAFDDGVQVTFVWNLGGEKPYPGRAWQKHGKLHWVDYSGESAETWFDGKKQGENGTIIVNGTEYPIDRILQSGRNYFQIRPLIEILNREGLKIEIGNIGSVAKLTFEAPEYDENGKIKR